MESSFEGEGFVISAVNGDGNTVVVYDGTGGGNKKLIGLRKQRSSKTSRAGKNIPVFSDMLPHAEHGFWKDLIKQFSQGNIQKSTNGIIEFDGKSIMPAHKPQRFGNTFSLERREGRDIKKIYEEMKIFLRNYDIMSEKERNERDQNFEAQNGKERPSINTFAQLKGSFPTAISNFVDMKAEKYNMTEKEKEVAAYTIRLYAIAFLDNSKVEVKDGKIIKIKRLKWSNSKRCFWFDYYDLPPVKIAVKTSKKDASTTFTYNTSGKDKLMRGVSNYNMSAKYMNSLKKILKKCESNDLK